MKNELRRSQGTGQRSQVKGHRAKLTASTILVLTVFVGALFAEETALWGNFFSQGDTKSKAIALTFDDGPNPSTLEVLKILEEAGVKATFFMSGGQVDAHPDIAKKVFEAGHEIGNHTYHHIAYHKYHGNAKEKLEEEITLAEDAIVKAIAHRPQILRMPHGFMRSWVKELAKGKRYVIVHWTFGEDWNKIPQAQMVKDYVAAVKPGAILLFHDGTGSRTAMLASLRAVLLHAQTQGYQALAASALLNLPETQKEP